MKTYKKIFSVILAMLIILSTSCISFASTLEANYNTEKYEEYHDQINFEDLMVIAVNNNDIVVDVDPTISLFKRITANKQKKNYDRYIENHPEAVSDLLDIVNSNDYLCAISYTEAPLVYIKDHYERIEKEDNVNLTLLGISASAADITKTSDDSRRHKLTLKTTVIRRGVSNPYSYQATTSGTWDNSASVFDGETQPAGGNDFVMQACPTVTTRSVFSSTYNYSTNGSKKGQEGINYFLTDGKDSWVKYEVVDDPLGLAQLQTFSLMQTFEAKATSTNKKINSYYIHTWKQMSVSVSVGGTAGVSGGKPTAGVSLSFTPTFSEKQWQLYNYVTYNW